ncbi:MAG: acetyl-CoA hydrolase/transferase C-terminal domain-containing protein [Syntrophomonadaceae bacterium]|nr:acetyl-CoA hydrolase/transferase C-terminal domain-containing protein [Syntrophomonadaceae bacterium]
MERWQKMYRDKRKTVAEIMTTIPPNAKIVTGIGNAQPKGLLTGLAELVKQGGHRELCYFGTMAVMGNIIADPAVSGLCRYQDSYATANVRPLFATAAAEYLPSMLSDSVRQLSETFDTVFQTVAPMDKHGYFSLGLEPDYVYGVIRSGKPLRIIFEVNEKFPSTFGDNHVHITEIEALVEHNWDMIAAPAAPPDEAEIRIAEHIAKLVPDGACLQLGIGGTPNAVGVMLEHKKDLGIHSEMICDAFLHLHKAGAINNRRKNFMPHRGVGTFVFGSQELYDWVEMNPGLEMWPANFVNDPRIACQNDNLIAVNGIVEADLTGQCVSEDMNGHTYSGLGGQQDFTLAAYWSKGGKAFLTLKSSRVDKAGVKHSNILPQVTGIVGMTRWNTHYVVTENGLVCLKGKSIPERVEGMIGIADPDFRDELRFSARKMGLLR